MVYLRFWYLLPRFIVSLLFAGSLAVLLRGESTYDDLVAVFEYVRVTGTEFWNGFLVVFLLLAIAWLAMVVQQAILIPATHVSGRILRMIFKERKVAFASLSAFELGRHLFRENHQEIMDFVNIRAISTPELFEEYKDLKPRIEMYYKMVSDQYLSVEDVNMLDIFTYESSLTQEQAHSDKYKNNIELLQFSLVLLPMLYFDMHVLELYSNWLAFVFLYLLWGIAVMYYYRRMKYKYAYYLMWSYLESFNIGEPAEIADRPI